MSMAGVPRCMLSAEAGFFAEGDPGLLTSAFLSL